MNIQAKGVSGTITFDGKIINIERSGILGRGTVGKGTKRFPATKLSSIQIKPAGPLMNGYIEFSLPGGTEARSSFGHATAQAGRNENAVVFTRKQQPDFLALRDAIESVIY